MLFNDWNKEESSNTNTQERSVLLSEEMIRNNLETHLSANANDSEIRNKIEQIIVYLGVYYLCAHIQQSVSSELDRFETILSSSSSTLINNSTSSQSDLTVSLHQKYNADFYSSKNVQGYISNVVQKNEQMIANLSGTSSVNNSPNIGNASNLIKDVRILHKNFLNLQSKVRCVIVLTYI
jgi:hypothetical protein